MDFEHNKSGLLVPVSFAAKSTSRGRPEMREVATTRDGRDITRGYVDPMLIQPPTDSVLRIRGNGDYQVYSEVLRDDQVASSFGQRRLALVGKEWAVDPGGESKADKAAAEHLEEMLQALGWDRVTDKMMYGVYYGFAVAEVMWARDGKHITIDDIKVRDRRRFGFDGEARLRMKTQGNPQGELLPDRKFWSFQTGADHDDEPYGIGLGHWLYWPVFFKRAGMRYWMTFLERFGQPTSKGTYPKNATPNERQKLLDALEAINTDSGIAVPDGMEIGLLEAARSGTADYSKLYEYMDRAIAKMTLGQTASSEGSPGRLGNDDLQGDVRTDLIKADGDLICESFNRSVVRWLTGWNYPNAKPPRVYRKVEPEEDAAKAAERDRTICDMGFRPTLKHIQDNYGGDWIEKAVEEPVPHSAADRNDNDAASFAEPDTRQPQTLSQQLDNQLQRQADGWINQIRALVNSAESLDEVRDGLTALLPDMNLAQYANLMAEALRVAELAGRDDLMNEVARAR